jgi:hypothetical protein
MRQTIRQSEQARWHHLRRLGQAKYILWYGVLRFGLVMLSFANPDFSVRLYTP